MERFYKGFDLILIDELLKNMTNDYDCYFPELCQKDNYNRIYQIIPFDFIREEQKTGNRNYNFDLIKEKIDTVISYDVDIKYIGFEYDPFEKCDGSCGEKADGHGHPGVSRLLNFNVGENAVKEFIEKCQFTIEQVQETDINDLMVLFDMIYTLDKRDPLKPAFLAHVNALKNNNELNNKGSN